VYTLGLQQGTSNKFNFLDPDIVSVFKQQPGQDITSSLNSVLDGKDLNFVNQNLDCMKRSFALGIPDFRKTARCQVQNVLLLVFSVILVTSMVLKCELAILFHFSRYLRNMHSLGSFAAHEQT